MGREIGSWEAPPLNLEVFVVSSTTPAFDWQDGGTVHLQGGGAGSEYVWLSIANGVAGLTAQFKVQTSPDGINWADFIQTTDVMSGSQFNSQIHPNVNDGINISRKLLKFVRLNYLSAGTPYTSGTLRWGLV